MNPVSKQPVAQQLLDTAMAIVERDGLGALTIRTLVTESGISNGSVYHHVGSLEQLRAQLAGEALKSWSTQFLTALDEGGLAAAAHADITWARRHPELSMMIEAEGVLGRLGEHAAAFGKGLRQWLDRSGLALGAPAHLVSAIVIGPLVELRRLQRAVGYRPSMKDLHALQTAITTGLAALGQPALPESDYP